MKESIKVKKRGRLKNGKYEINVLYTTIPEKVEISGWIVPVPYVTVGFVSGQKTCYFLGVEIPGDKLQEYINHGEGRLDLDYITAIYPYGDNCPLDNYILSHPKFVNKPVHCGKKKQ